MREFGLEPEAQGRRRVYVLDYVLPGPPSVVVEVNGCYWHAHGCDRDKGTGQVGRRRRDIDLRADLAIAGRRLAIVWECAIAEHGVEQAVANALAVAGITTAA